MLSADDVAKVAARVRAEPASEHVPMAAPGHASVTFCLANDVGAEARSLVRARGLALAWVAARRALASGRPASVGGAHARAGPRGERVSFSGLLVTPTPPGRVILRLERSCALLVVREAEEMQHGDPVVQAARSVRGAYEWEIDRRTLDELRRVVQQRVAELGLDSSTAMRDYRVAYVIAQELSLMFREEDESSDQR